MADKKKTDKKVAVESYRHESATRKNIPTAKIAAEGTVPRVAKAKYAYSAFLSPELRFDASGRSDRVTEIVEKVAAGNKLTKEETDILQGLAANASQPWLEWSGKKEEHDQDVLEVEPVALHIHERVSADAIIRAAKREDLQADLFADPKQDYREAIQFYNHDVDWANRLVLGDSLEVMSSLARREDLAAKVQMIYVDPPYGIKFASNFQSDISRRDVGDKESDLTREPEMVRAYRDTWHLGTHSYLSYLRARLIASKSMLTASGSIFLQMGEENVHMARNLMDEVFGPENFVSQISVYKTTTPRLRLDNNLYYLLWYARSIEELKYRQLFLKKPLASWARDTKGGSWGLRMTNAYRSLHPEEKANASTIPKGSSIYQLTDLTSAGASVVATPFLFEGNSYEVRGKSHWKTTSEGLKRLALVGRVESRGGRPWFRKHYEDYPVRRLTNVWSDTSGKATERRYVVQTQEKVIERCMLMTTDPGDLVLDPTCGSGTTAFVAEQWGRRWITIDSSRVALAVARQRLLTSRFPRYRVRGELNDGTADRAIDPCNNFEYETVPHITLGAIAKNENLDPLISVYQDSLNSCLEDCNFAIRDVTAALRTLLLDKLASKLQEEGLRSVTAFEQRRWLLPGTTRQELELAFSSKSRLTKKHIEDYFGKVPLDGKYDHWNVPFDVDEDWPEDLRASVQEYSKVQGVMLAEVDDCIKGNSEQEVLVDKPREINGIVRVTGPFTVEGVRPEELSLDENGELFDPSPNELEFHIEHGEYSQNASAYIDRMLQLISQDGVTFSNNEHRKFALVERLEETDSALHAEALWEGVEDGDLPNVAIAFGPQHGPVTASQVEDLIRASRRYDELAIAAFSFDGSSQAVIQESANPRLKIHMAHIRPDVSPGMDGLLKDSPKSQLFTVFGQPEIDVRVTEGEAEVELLGVDIYSPLTGEITSSGANKVAAWFLDSDYDGRCFCITQAFFPNQKAWDKIIKALGSSADVEAFEAYNGTVSVPFEPGEHQRIAVKVIDPRGNEVMAIRNLKDLI